MKFIKDKRSKEHTLDLDPRVENKEILICINSCTYDSRGTYMYCESYNKTENVFGVNYGLNHEFCINDIICLTKSQCEVIGIFKNGEIVDYEGNNYLEVMDIKDIIKDILNNFVNFDSFVRDNKINDIFKK